MFGTVTKYDRIRGFGFIVADEPNLPDFFVCAKFIDANKHRRFLIVGQRVEFTPIDADTDRPVANPVRPIFPVTIAVQRGKAEQS